MGKGVPIGVSDLYYALLIDDPLSGTAVYQTPKRIPGVISANVNPNGSNDTLFADDGPYETASTIGQISLELNVADLSIEMQAELLGHTIVAGILMRKSSDVPPWVAIGFKSLKSNGKYRYTWLNKGKFALPEQANKTKGDSIEFNTPTISGSFVKRECDNEWERHTDEDCLDYMPIVGSQWFNNPYGGSVDTTPPSVQTCTPVAGATTVAVSSAVTVLFNEALALSTVHSANFMLLKSSDGVQVPCSISINTARTQVTLTPSSNLASATQYQLVITTGVRDLTGNAMAATYFSTFTTA